jgi:probable GTP-binding protein engB
MYHWICHQGYEPIIIATKLDKIKRSQIQKQIKIIKEGLNCSENTTILPFSSQSKQGKEELYALIEKIVNQEG